MTAFDSGMTNRLNRSRQQFDTGRIFENATLGPYKHDNDYKNAMLALIEKYKDVAEIKGWTPYDETMNLLREHYAGDVLNPEKRFAEDLRLEIIDALLEILPHGARHVDIISDAVRYYSGVETGLDYFHGIDAWFEIEDANGKRATFTIDVTTDPNKRSAKASMVINQEDMRDPSEGEDAYYAYVGRIAHIIAEELAIKLRRMKMITRNLKRAA